MPTLKSLFYNKEYNPLIGSVRFKIPGIKNDFMFCAEKAGVISEKAIWILFHENYGYMSETIPGLLWEVFNYWKHDRSLMY